MLRDPSPPMETPISARREARNTGFVVYMSFTMEPPPTLRPSSFTVNWKSNPLTNSWTEGERVFSHEITILPWYRLTISLLRILYLSEEGRNSRVSSRRDKGIQESTVVSLMCFVSKIRSEEEKRNGGKGKISKERDFINDTMGQRNVYFLRIRDRNRNRARF